METIGFLGNFTLSCLLFYEKPSNELRFTTCIVSYRRKMIAVKPLGCVNLRGVNVEQTILGSGIKGFTIRPKVNFTDCKK